jgi:hypothetical protein
MRDNDQPYRPKPPSLGEFLRTEFANGIADVRSALIDESWFDRTSSSVTHINQPSQGWERSDELRAGRDAQDPFGHRWSDADSKRLRPEHDHPQELDFDR